MKKNILLLILLIILSALLAIPFGRLVISHLFNTSGGFATFSLPSDLGNFLNGMPYLYLLLAPFLFGTFGKGKKWIWSIVSTIPILYFLFYIESGKLIWFWSLIFFVSGIILAFIFQKLFKRNPAQSLN
mgnify:FL=1